MYVVRAISQVDNLIAAQYVDVEEAKKTAEKLTAATPNRTFRYEVWHGAEKVWPPAVVVV